MMLGGRERFLEQRPCVGKRGEHRSFIYDSSFQPWVDVKVIWEHLKISSPGHTPNPLTQGLWDDLAENRQEGRVWGHRGWWAGRVIVEEALFRLLLLPW